jgi:O-antigen/teichoic acid export membrane protein
VDGSFSYAYILRSVFSFGALNQLGQLIQYLNYRLGYYFLLRNTDTGSVGIYSVGVMLSEAIWTATNSIALIQYSNVATTDDAGYAMRSTIRLTKLSFVVTACILLVVGAVPAGYIQMVIGKDFSSVKNVILSLSVGILSLSAGSVISHYFAGLGKYHLCAISSAIGFVFTLLGGWLLIPRFGIFGAGFTASISYLMTSLALVIIFLRSNNLQLISFLLQKDDVTQLRTSILQLLNKRSEPL